MKSALALIVFLLILWGLLGLMEGIGFFGGIRAQFVAAWNILGILGRIVVIVIIIGVFIKAP
jgi:hypothetical protein